MNLILSDNKVMNIQEEIYKCSKCGLCKSVCPVFNALKNEIYVSRGRYIVLNSFFNRKKKLSRDFIQNLDICLNCNVCKEYCPSNIDAYRIFTEIKNKNNYKYSFFNFSFLYKIILIKLFILKVLYKVFPFKSLFIGTYTEKIFTPSVIREKQSKNNQSKGNIIYFSGCFNKYINDSDKKATINLIEKCGYNVKKVINLCCGYPYINEGNYKKFKQNAKKIINQLNTEYDYIVCSCDSCFDTLKRIHEFIPNDDYERKLIRLDEFLKMNNFINTSATKKTQYFKPLLRNEICYFPNNIEKIHNKKTCSLMENFFILKYKNFSNKILNSVYIRKDTIQDNTIITSCMLTKWGLQEAFNKLNFSNKVLSYAEYMDLTSKIK